MLYKDLSEDGVEPPAARRRRSQSPARSIRTRHSLSLTSRPRRLIPWQRRRSTRGSMRLQAIRHPFSFLTGCPPVNSATRSSCSMRARLSSREPTPNWSPTTVANITIFGMHRHSIIRSKFSSFGAGVLRVSQADCECFVLRIKREGRHLLDRCFPFLIFYLVKDSCPYCGS